MADAGETAVVALSYDPVEILATFAASHGVTYPLLSDVGSRVIEELGLLNTHIAEDQAVWGKPYAERHHGLPYPATILLDRDGVVVDRVFERSHRVRPTGGLLLEMMQGPAAPPPSAHVEEASGVAVAVWADPNPAFPGQVGRIRARLRVPDGSHVYVGENPASYTCVAVEAGPVDGLDLLAPTMPDGTVVRVEALDEEWTVAGGDVDVTLPFFLEPGVGSLDLEVTIRFQSCTDVDCLPPATVTAPIRLEERSE